MATTLRAKEESLIAIIGDEDTITGLLLAGMGDLDAKRSHNFFIVDSKTPPQKIEEAFKMFTARTDIAVLLITQNAAAEIRILLEEYEKLVPTVLEIPSKDKPYDPKQDVIMQRLKRMIGQE
ncbi:vacuolar H+ ATPase F subunit [Pelomyxa schiedti]|nr:vacuolar H+ ATPase F subunit [Pelomyxa schiedti]